MANTYTQIHIQFVFAVRFREAVIHSSWKDELYRYMTGIVKKDIQLCTIYLYGA
jgi:putative transposase